MKIKVLNYYKKDNKHVYVFKYWQNNQCYCTATKVKRAFDDVQTKKMLIESIS